MKDLEYNEGIKVSIVVPIYKVAPYLDKMIQSIQSQTHRNIEAILVDDGSPDECGNICDRYAEMDSRIIVIHQLNKGCCAARNKGLEVITGDWFTFVDGDDWVEPDYIEYLLRLAIDANAEMALTDSRFTTRDLKQSEQDAKAKWTPEEASSRIVKGVGTGLTGCYNKLYNTAVWKRSGVTFDVPWGGEGIYFAALVAQHANYIAKGHRRIYVYRRDNPSSSMTSNDMKVAVNFLQTIITLKKVTTIRTPRFMHALEWREWITYRMLHRTIIANHAQNDYFRLLLRCRMMLRWLMPGVLIHKQYNDRFSPWIIIKHSIFPSFNARKVSRGRKRKLEQDMLTAQ